LLHKPLFFSFGLHSYSFLVTDGQLQAADRGDRATLAVHDIAPWCKPPAPNVGHQVRSILKRTKQLFSKAVNFG
jgi:hypothetical protein